MRIVADSVRGMRVSDALSTLHYMPQVAAKWVESTIHSAVHNLMDQHSEERFDEDDLVIREIVVNQAPMFKRIRPAPRGRAHRIRKRNSHLTVVVGAIRDSADSEEAED
jgi:large subunit ribosomal protein L22